MRGVIVAWISVVIAYSQISFEKTVHDFGVFDEGKIVEYTFKFKNTGDKPVWLTRVKPSCGCTTPQWTRDTIPPGGSGSILVKYNSQGRPGKFKKSITVFHSASDQPIVLYIQGEARRKNTTDEQYPEVVGNLAFKQTRIHAGEIKSNENKTFTIEVKNIGENPITFQDIKAKSMFTVLFNPQILYPSQKGQILIKYHADKAKENGYIYDRTFYENIKIVTDDEVYPLKDVYIIGSFKKIFTEEELKNAPKVVFEELEFDGGDIIQGDKLVHDFYFKNEGKGDLIIQDVKASCGCTASKPEKEVLKPGEKSYIRVTFDSTGKLGTQHKTVTVFTNDPQNPRVILHVRCNVIKDPFTAPQGLPH